MAQASHKITEFPGISDALEPIAALPADFLTQDRDPTREIRNLIDELQNTAREARRRQRQAEEEREQMRGKLLDMQEQIDSGEHHNSQIKGLVRERDMLLSQQSQYGPVISDLKQRLKATEGEIHEALSERDAAAREKKQLQRLAEEAENKRAEAFRQRDSAIRQRDLAKEEREEAMEKAAQAKKNFTDAQKAIAETQKALAEARQELASAKKKGDGELAGQLDSLRQARDGMSAQIKQLQQRIGELEDESAEAGYAREAAEKAARESQAQLTDIQGVLEAAAAGNDAQKMDQLEASLLELQSQLAAAEKRNKTLSENEARLSADMVALREEMQASLNNRTDKSALLEEARASLVAAQKQIEAIIRDRDSIREQLSENVIALEAQIKEQSVMIARLRQTLNDNEGKVSQRGELEVQFERRRLDMIELNTKLENAHREIRNLSASLAEARLHAKLSGHPMPAATVFENRNTAANDPVQGNDAIIAMRRCFQAFSRDQKQVGILGELETHSLKIADKAMQDGHPILHRVSTAFASLLGDLLEVPEQITQSTLRTLNQGIEFIALLLSDPEIENSIKLNEARVYVVDDDADSCITAVDALNLVGIQANHALNSSAAVAELASNKYDLIILDVHLPDLSGFELSSHIRNMALHAETPIFFVTGDSSLENRVKSSLRGGNEFIAKPFSVQELALKSLKSVITGQLRNR
jgi:CheY-like chemotaxis protein